jgi:thioredoxin-like negative regulator of GroEL
MQMMRDTVDRLEMVTEETFEDRVIRGSGPIVVEFMSYGCGHCRTLEPVLQHVAAMLAPRERFYRVNVAVDDALAERFDIRATPTLVMFANAVEVGRVEGPSPHASRLLTALTRPFTA